jgi:hypothetical protein
MNIDDIKPNSNTYKESQQQAQEKAARSKVKPVVGEDGLAGRSKNKTLGNKFSGLFKMIDLADLASWAINDCLIPNLKDFAMDCVSMVLFGEPDSRGGRRRSGNFYDRNKSMNSYSSYYNGNKTTSSRDRDRDNRRNDRSRQDQIDYTNIVLLNRDDAERVVDELKLRIREEDYATIADLYELVMLPSEYTDHNYGWTNERQVGYRRVRDGYLIDVDKPIYIK